VPQETQSPDHRLEDNFWSLLLERHPLTWWWWGPGEAAPGEFFPEWSAGAFEREAGEWRHLATSTVDMADEEVVHWGRFARTTAARLASGSWQDASELLRHANTTLTLVDLLDPTGDQCPRARLLDRMAVWLDQAAGVTAGGVWRKVRIKAEASRLLTYLAKVQDDNLVPSRDRGAAAVHAYVDRAVGASDEFDAVPWASSAHVFVETWREFRQAFTGERPIIVDRPVRGDELLLNRGLENFPDIQDVVVPAAGQWWVRPTGEKITLFHNGRMDGSLAAAVVLGLWHQVSHANALTWALTPAPHIEGGMHRLAVLVEDLWPRWAPVETHLLAQFRQRRTALAVADAWLWLEGGNPEAVAIWLSRFLPKAAAQTVIPWMKSHPGYYVQAHRVYESLSHDTGAAFSAWPFVHGPVMPADIYQSPAELPHDRS
jgi:hypothetical protein